MTPISKELSGQINQEAATYAALKRSNSVAESFCMELGYKAGATAYAHYKERWEQAKKALEDIASGKVLPQLIAQQALASWKEEGKEVKQCTICGKNVKEGYACEKCSSKV